MKLFQFFLCLITIHKIISEYAFQYEETKEMSLKRLHFGQNYTDKVTGGKVKFEYTDSNGVFCKANTDLYGKEFTFHIPKEFIICTFDIFPFKFELHEAVMQFLSKKYQKGSNDTKTRGPLYLFGFGLMFIKYENKSLVNDYLKRNKLEYYAVNYTKELMNYVDTLPTSTYTTHVYSEIDRQFLKNIGFTSQIKDELKEVFDYVIDYVNNNKLFHMKKVLLPFISNLDLYRYCISMLTSRAYQTILYNYETLFNLNLDSTPIGKKHKELILDMASDGTGTCLIPFIDLCNHKSSNDRYGKDKIDFIVMFKKDKVKFAFTKEFKEGEEYVYSYHPIAQNERLLFSYGFYTDNNPQSLTVTFFKLFKKDFTRAKHDLSIKLKCFDNPFPEFYKQTLMDNANVQSFMNKFEINLRILNTLRLYFIPNEKFNSLDVYKILSKNKWISFENEALALSYYRTSVIFHFSQFMIKRVILFIIKYLGGCFVWIN